MKNNLLHTPISLPPYEVVQITPQVDAVIMERHTLPLTAFKLVIWGGSTDDPVGKEGLWRLTAKLLQKGAGAYSADKFAFLIERLGAVMTVQTGYESVTIDGHFLSKDTSYGLELLAAMILEPRFSHREILLLKQKTVNEIIAFRDEPGNLCSILHSAHLFQKHPYARPIIGTGQSVKNAYREEIIRIYEEQLCSSRMMLVIVGDIKKSEIISKVRALFNSIRSSRYRESKSPTPATGNGRTFYLVHKAEQTQAHIRIGNVGIARKNPDFHRLIVTNTLLGGSFTSRLMREIRVKQGLTYGIRSSFSMQKYGGSITIATFTKTASTGRTIELIFEEMHKFRTAGVSSEDLEGAKRYIVGLYPLSLETNKRISQHLSNVYFYGLPKNSIEKYPDSINGVSQDDIIEMGNRYFDENNAVITILGDAGIIAPQMSRMGNVINESVNG